jgi:hypothetical protein
MTAATADSSAVVDSNSAADSSAAIDSHAAIYPSIAAGGIVTRFAGARLSL